MFSLTFVVKPVGDRCNLRCRYCYNNESCRNDKSTIKIMSDEVLVAMTEGFLAIPQERPCFIWHGGEPLLAGTEFFRRALELQKRILLRSRIVVNKVQSNGTLIDEEWALLAKKESLRFGVSLDGPETVHDSFRKYPNGRGSFGDAFRGVTTLQQAGARFGLGAVVSQANLCDPRGLFDFFATRFRRFGFSPYTKTAVEACADGEFAITPWEWAEFFKTAFNLWWERDDSRINVREFRDVVLAILGKMPKICSMSGGCYKFLCVDADGSVYPCGRLAGIKELRFGSTLEQPLSSILESERTKDYYRTVLAVPESCKKCPWFYACHNGCAARRYQGYGKFLESDPFCEATQAIFTFVAEKVGVTKEYLDQKQQLTDRREV